VVEGTEDVRAVQRRTLAVVVAAQVLAGAGLAAGITVGALLAQAMVGGGRTCRRGTRAPTSRCPSGAASP
jgi:hypothetical protein